MSQTVRCHLCTLTGYAPQPVRLIGVFDVEMSKDHSSPRMPEVRADRLAECDQPIVGVPVWDMPSIRLHTEGLAPHGVHDPVASPPPPSPHACHHPPGGRRPATATNGPPRSVVRICSTVPQPSPPNPAGPELRDQPPAESGPRKDRRLRGTVPREGPRPGGVHGLLGVGLPLWVLGVGLGMREGFGGGCGAQGHKWAQGLGGLEGRARLYCMVLLFCPAAKLCVMSGGIPCQKNLSLRHSASRVPSVWALVGCPCSAFCIVLSMPCHRVW